jgi:CRP-like cAMP-binding protein
MVHHRPAQARDPMARLFAGVALDAQREITAGSRRRLLRPGQVLFRTGEPAYHLFVLRKGRIEFTRIANNGREVVIGILGPGDIFGLGSLLEGIPYIGTAQALEAGEVVVWRREVIKGFAEKCPQLSLNALQEALRYVALFIERHERLVSSSAEQRLARALTRLGVQTGAPAQRGVEVRVKNEQLASLADVSPFTASRMLKHWVRSGAITKGRGVVNIMTPEKLMLG